MAVFGWSTIPILLLFPAFFFLGMAGGLADAPQRERVYARRRLFLRYLLATAVALGIVNAATANRGIMDIVRWKRVLLRVVRLLAVSLNAICCFILLDSAAGIFLRVGVDDSMTAASTACAIVVVATHLRVAWMAVFKD